jgi:hypothetical protein
LISDLAYIAGPSFYFLFILFPSDYASSAALTAETLMRLSGVAFACAWGYYFFLARFGIQELLDLHKPWRLFLAGLCIIGAMLGGYRGLLIMMAMVVVVLFFVEGVYKTRLGPAIIFASLFLLVGTITFVDKMPLSVQRAFSFLPMEKIDPTARLDALSTLDWRLSMWKILIPEIPKYLILGKGYSFSGTDYYLTQEAVRRGLYTPYEDTLISGNYHNGILTLLIPFGIFGFLTFLCFCGAGLWTLLRNHRYGDSELKPYNTFLLAYFISQLLFYFIFYGQFDLDLIHFTGTVGLSVALNGGVCSAARRETETVLAGELVPAT